MADEAALDHLQEAGYVILRNCIRPKLVRDTRNSIDDEVRAVTNASKETLFLSAIERSADWPEECKRLIAEIRVDGENSPIQTHIYWSKDRKLSHTLPFVLKTHQPNQHLRLMSIKPRRFVIRQLLRPRTYSSIPFLWMMSSTRGMRCWRLSENLIKLSRQNQLCYQSRNWNFVKEMY